MLSMERYAGEASMARTARNAAGTVEEQELYGEAFSAHLTAANHAKLAARWTRNAAADRAAAGQVVPVSRMPALRGTIYDTRAVIAHLRERATRSAEIAVRHRLAAEAWGEKGFAYYAEAEKMKKNGNGQPAAEAEPSPSAGAQPSPPPPLRRPATPAGE